MAYDRAVFRQKKGRSHFRAPHLHFLPKGGATTELAQACAGALSYCGNATFMVYADRKIPRPFFSQTSLRTACGKII